MLGLLSCSLYVLSSVLMRIFANVQVTQAAKDVSASYDALIDLLESVDNFLSRLNIYTKIPPTPIMAEIMVKIIVELLSTLAVATKQIKQGTPSKFGLTHASHNSRWRREIHEEAVWREGRRGGATEAR
jgi:hypothetical protein